MQQNLKKLRIQKGLTRKHVANAVGVSEMSIYNWETGKRKPRIDIAEKLMKALR